MNKLIRNDFSPRARQYVLATPPPSILDLIRAKLLYHFRPSKLTFAGVQRVEVLRLPNGRFVSWSGRAQNLPNSESLPFPPNHLIVSQQPVEPADLLTSDGMQVEFTGDNMPDECSPDPVEEDLSDKLHREAAELEDAADPTVPSIKKE